MGFKGLGFRLRVWGLSFRDCRLGLRVFVVKDRILNYRHAFFMCVYIYIWCPPDVPTFFGLLSDYSSASTTSNAIWNCIIWLCFTKNIGFAHVF